MATSITNTEGAKEEEELCEWLVIIPDVQGEGTLERRMGVRPTHFKNLTPIIDSGFLQFGGALLATSPKGNDPLQITGSALLARARTREEVLRVVREDVYAREGVWDLEKVQIYPFKCAFRKAL